MARTKHQASKKSKNIIGKNTGDDAGKERKKRRFRPGTVALRQIKKYQRSTDLLLPKAPFRRLVREIAADFKTDIRFEGDAFRMLQEIAEAHLTDMFRRTNNAAIHAKRVSIFEKDMKFAVKQTLEQEDAIKQNALDNN